MPKIYDKSTAGKFIEAIRQRVEVTFADAETDAAAIIASVRKDGDEALRKYSKLFDNYDFAPGESFFLSEDELNAAANRCPFELIAIMEKAAQNIEDFHSRQGLEPFIFTNDGAVMGQLVTPIERVAMYVPGGSAAYPSSVLMNAIPAKIAGVTDFFIMTPPKAEGLNPAVAAAAKIAGVSRVCRIGGAQAVAAAAYGTESVPRAGKITGPGNAYVAAAKKLVFGKVDIDMIAGPSEILIVADESADPVYIAADLMSQAEHDVLASSILVTDSKKLAEAVNREIERQIASLTRREIIEKSLNDFGGCVICADISEAIAFANDIAPEHLELMVEDTMDWLSDVRNAGSIFLGKYAPEPLGDYFAGANHVLPTSGTAKFSSPLGVDSFLKRSSFIYYPEVKLMDEARDIIKFAESEGLTAHANSIKVRLDDAKK
ncbi:histidinol dehydrogenase [Clostridia bacterium]|nr:histidinol dehydrogenase [Clostridia bacterium]